MPLAKKLIRRKFCCCLSLTSGCIMISFYTLFFGFINAGTIVDDALYQKAFKTDPYTKWFNIFHVALMIAAAIVLLVSVLTKQEKVIFVWVTMFIVHMIAYYIGFHAMLNVRIPFFTSVVSGSIYVLCMCLTLNIFCLYTVFSFYYILTHPKDFLPPCVDK